jgi:hypothetical protein
LLLTSAVPTNSGEEAARDLPDDTADNAGSAAGEIDPADAVDLDPEALERSQDAIDQGWEAAQSALQDTSPDDEETND